MPYFCPCHLTEYGVVPQLHEFLERDGISIAEVIDIVRSRPTLIPHIPGKPLIVGIIGRLKDGRTISLGVRPSGRTSYGCTREVAVTHYKILKSR